jgi:hypothetical protein
MELVLSTLSGLDLGQRNDHSALAILDVVEVTSPRRDPVTFAYGKSYRFDVRSVSRIPLGTPYTEIPTIVRENLHRPPLNHLGERRPATTLAVDAGGPGLPVVELLRQARLDCYILPAVITGGNAGSSLPGGIYSVPRKELVSLLRIAIESRILVFPANLPLKEELAAELRAIEPNGGQSKHDDMAIAISLALWASNIRIPGLIQQHRAA